MFSTSSAGDRLKEAHKLMGISSKLSLELGEIFNHWSKVRITDAEVRKLIQVAMAPSKEVVANLQKGELESLSSLYKNTVDNVFDYAMSHPSQQLDTTKGTLFGAYNAITGYYQNVCKFSAAQDKFKSITEGTAKLRAQSAFNLCLGLSAGNGAGLIFN